MEKRAHLVSKSQVCKEAGSGLEALGEQKGENQKAPQLHQETNTFSEAQETQCWGEPFLLFYLLWLSEWPDGAGESPLCLRALGGFDFAHLVAVWIVLITIRFMKDPCFFYGPHSTVLERATRGVTYQESQVLGEVNNTWFNRLRREHKCWLGLWPSIFFL